MGMSPPPSFNSVPNCVQAPDFIATAQVCIDWRIQEWKSAADKLRNLLQIRLERCSEESWKSATDKLRSQLRFAQNCAAHKLGNLLHMSHSTADDAK